jgi:hypothetical protein
MRAEARGRAPRPRRARPQAVQIPLFEPAKLARALPPRARYFFDAFLARAGRRRLRPDDWRAFYRFVRASRAGHILAQAQDVYEHLIAAGFERRLARELSTLYRHVRGMYADAFKLREQYPRPPRR